MRVCILAPEFLPPWGGVGIYTVGLVKELSKNSDYEVYVFTPKKGKNYKKEDVLEYFDHKIEIHNIGSSSDDFVYNLFFQYNIAKKIPEYNKKYKFDILHSANLVHMPDIFLKFRKIDVPSIVTAHTTIKGQVSGFLKGNKNFFRMAHSEKWSILTYPLINILENYYLKKTKYMITVSKKFVDIFKRGYHYKGIIKPIHNGVDIDYFDYSKITEEDSYDVLPELEGIKDPMVLFAGRLITQKGIEIFVRSMKSILSKTKKVHFVIAGRGDEKQLFDLLKRYDIPTKNITFLGFVDNRKLPWLYRLTNIFVLPSFYENFPIGLLEAMAMKNTCIASNVGAVDEIIDDGINGFLIEAGDYEKLTKYIFYLLENEDIRENLAENGFNKVRNNFTSVRMVEETKKFYEMILEGNNEGIVSQSAKI